MNKTKPSAREITKAREGAKRHHPTVGEEQAVRPRRPGTPTKKRPAGETSRTRNEALERPAPAPPVQPTRRRPPKARAGKRKPKHARKLEQARSARKD